MPGPAARTVSVPLGPGGAVVALFVEVADWARPTPVRISAGDWSAEGDALDDPVIGYLKAAEIAKQAYREGRPILDVAAENTKLSREELETLLDPARLTQGRTH